MSEPEKKGFDLEEWTLRCVAAGFCFGVLSLMGMSVAVVWEHDTSYRVFASGAAVFWILFGAAFFVGVFIAAGSDKKKSTSKPT